MRDLKTTPRFRLIRYSAGMPISIRGKGYPLPAKLRVRQGASGGHAFTVSIAAGQDIHEALKHAMNCWQLADARKLPLDSSIPGAKRQLLVVYKTH